MDLALKNSCKNVLNENKNKLSKNDYKNAIKYLRLRLDINTITNFSHLNICKLINKEIEMKQKIEENLVKDKRVVPKSKFRELFHTQSGRKAALLCAQYITSNEEIQSSDQKKLKQFMRSKNIPFNENDQPRLLCQKLLENLKPNQMMPLMPFANQLISEEIKRQDDIEVQLEAEQEALKLKRKFIKIQNQSFDNDLSCSNSVFSNNTYQTVIDETLGHAAHIAISRELYEPLINLAVDNQINAPLIELTTLNRKNMYVRFQQKDVPEGVIFISPLVAATLGGPVGNEVTCKWCTNIQEPSKFYFILFDNENTTEVNEELKSKIQESLQRYLERYAGIKVGIKIPILLNDKIITLVIEKILDKNDPPNPIHVSQTAAAAQVDFEIRSEKDAFDEEGNLIQINDGDSDSLVFGMNY
jgi:hypothetical protein